MQLNQGLSAGSLFAGRYSVRRPLGVGGMGVVYLAHDNTLDEEVALKVLHPHRSSDQRLAERFLQEVKLSRRLVSPHIVRTFDVGAENGQLFFTMEYIPGESLKDRIARQQLDRPNILRILADIAAGLSAIHEAGVIHRDLKPSNVMLPSSGGTKIADFGVARGRTSELTNSDEIIGSIEYIAPECWTNHAVSAASDLYSLGIIAYELLTGTLPFSGSTSYEVMVKTVNQAPLSPRHFKADIPEWLDQLILNLLDKRPNARPKSAEKVYELIERKLGFELASKPGTKSEKRTKAPTGRPKRGSSAFFRSVILDLMQQAHIAPDSTPALNGSGSVKGEAASRPASERQDQGLKVPQVEVPLVKIPKATINEDRRDSALIFRPADWVRLDGKWADRLIVIQKFGALILGLGACALLVSFYKSALTISPELGLSAIKSALTRLFLVVVSGTLWHLLTGFSMTAPFEGVRRWLCATITAFFVGVVSIATSAAWVFNQLPSTEQHLPYTLASFMSAVGASLTNLLEACLVIPTTALYSPQLSRGSVLLVPTTEPSLGILLYFGPLFALLLVTGAARQLGPEVDWRAAGRFAFFMLILLLFEMAICGALRDPTNLASQLSFILPLSGTIWRTSGPAIFFAAFNWVLIAVGLPWQRK